MISPLVSKETNSLLKLLERKLIIIRTKVLLFKKVTNLGYFLEVRRFRLDNFAKSITFHSQDEMLTLLHKTQYL